MYLRVICVGKDHQRNFLGDLGKTLGDVGVGPPGWNGIVDLGRIRLSKFHLPFAAETLDGVADDFVQRLPVAENFVEPICPKVREESLHLPWGNTVGKQLATHRSHLVIG